MRTRELLQRAIAEETRLLLHLAAKVRPEDLAFRPTPAQRSTLELLRYLVSCGIGPARALLEGDWEASRQEREQLAELSLDEVPAALERQRDRLFALMGSLSEEDFESGEIQVPWREEPLNLGEAFLEMPVKFLTAYRMQLFLYLKAAGQEGLSTHDCWLGEDTPPGGPSA